jgi:hypothetical protein
LDNRILDNKFQTSLIKNKYGLNIFMNNHRIQTKITSRDINPNRLITTRLLLLKFPCSNVWFNDRIIPNYNYPLNMTCSCCKCNMNTVVNNEYGNTAIMWSALICCCVGQCCCVPFLWDNCLDKSHYCPNCGHNVLRKHQRCFDFINWF